MRLRLPFPAALAASLLCACGASARQTDNHVLHAVPVSDRVRIDGDLEEWDRSGEIIVCSNVEEFLDVFSARVSMMYDDEALYVGIDWTDSTPMHNLYHPMIDVDRRFAFHSDSVQIHFFKGPKAKKLIAWYYTKNRTPGAYVLDGHDPFRNDAMIYHEAMAGLGVEQAFRRHADGKGYSQEMRVPFSAVGVDAEEFAPGHEFPCMLDLVWGPDDGRTWPVNHAMDLVEAGEAHTGWFWEVGEIHGRVVLSPNGDLELDRPDFTALVKHRAPSGTLPVRIEIPRDAKRFTIAIDDSNQRRVRNVAGDYDAETYTVELRENTRVVEVLWDCLDDEKAAVPAGEYTVRGLSHCGFDAFYETCFYNPGSPPWETSDGSGAWGADHSAPSEVASSGERTVIGWAGVEGGSGLVGIGREGNKLWGDRGRQGVTALAADGNDVYFMLNNSWARRSGLARLDIRTGDYKPYMIAGEQHFPVALGTIFGDEPPGRVTDMTAHGDRLVLALGQEGIAILDATTSELVHRRPELHATRVAFGGDGALYCIDQSMVERIDLATFGRSVVHTPFLGEAGDVAVDAEGNVAVLDTGPDSQVKVYDSRGHMLCSAGKRGGRAMRGEYDPRAMRDMSSLDIDARGRIWVAENGQLPRRVSVWNSRGEFLREYVGNTSYAAGGCFLHDQNPALAYVGPIEIELDRERNRHRVREILWAPDAAKGESFPIDPNTSRHAQRLTSSASGREREYLYSHDGPQVVYMKRARTWQPVAALCNVGQIRGARAGTRVDTRIDFAWGDTPPLPKMKPSNFAVRWQGRVIAAEAGTYTFLTTSDDGVRLTLDGTRIIDNWSHHGPTTDAAPVHLDAVAHDIVLEYFQGTGGAMIRLEWERPGAAREVIPGSVLRASDSPDAPHGLTGSYYHSDRPDGVLYAHDRDAGLTGFEDLPIASGIYWSDGNGDGKIQRAECTVADASIGMDRAMTDWGRRIGNDLSIYTLGITRYKPVRFTEDGAPVYSPEGRHDIGNDEPGDLVPVEDENLLLCLSFKNYAGPTTGMLGIDLRNGTTKWSYPNLYPSVHGSHRAPLARPGLLIGPLKILGVARVSDEVGRVFALRGNLGQDFIFTTDGLYAGALFKDGRLASTGLPETEAELRGKSMAGFSNGGEPFNGWFGRQSDGKIRTVTGMPRQAAMVLEVTGLDTIRRVAPTPLSVAEADLAKARAFVATRHMAKSEEKEYTVTRSRVRPTIDADAVDWQAVPALTIERGDSPHRGTARLTYDAENLYALFEIEDSSPWLNSGKDFTKLFKTGDAVDLQLGTAAARKEPSPGDLRVVIAPHKGAATAVLMIQRAVGSSDDSVANYRSPVAQIQFDRVQIMTAAVIAVRVNDRGYIVEAALPLSALGLRPERGATMGGDSGIISSDARGIVNVARTYWSNKDTNLVNDLPQEARIAPAGWGTIRFE